MKLKYLYHGTSNGKIRIFEPRKPKDKVKHNNICGVYASNKKTFSILMGMIGNIKGGSAVYTNKKGKYFGVINKEKNLLPKEFFLYKLPINNFLNLPKGSDQWVSMKKVEPLSIEKLSTQKYKHLVITNEEFEKLKSKTRKKKK